MVSHDVTDLTDEAIVHTENNVSIYCGDNNKGNGTLFITENILLWKNETEVLKFYYPSISLHAICRDTAKFPHECIYCLVEPSESTIECDENNADDEFAESPISEIRLVPQNKDNLKGMYDAITKCQELNPDLDEEFSEEDTEDGDHQQYFESLNEVEGGNEIDMSGFYTAANNIDEIELSEQGMQVLQRLQENMRISNSNGAADHRNGHQNGNDQFEDAEEQ